MMAFMPLEIVGFCAGRGGGRDKCNSIVECLVGYWGHGEEGVAMVPID